MIDDETKADPSVVLDLLEAFRHSKSMFAAVSLGVFDALKPAPMPLARLAKTLNVNADALERLLDACVGLGLLARHGEDYRNTLASTKYLCRDSPDRLTDYIGYSNTYLWKLWGNLEDAIREGTNRWKQTFGWDEEIFDSFLKDEATTRSSCCRCMATAS